MNPHLTKNAGYGKIGSLFICGTVYLLAGLALCFLYPVIKSQGSILSALILDIIATIIVYFASLLFRNASLYDPYWSVAPVPIALFWWASEGFEMANLRQILAFVVLSFWSIRLTSNWIRGWGGLTHEDWRYGMLRQNTGIYYPLVNLTGIHLFPTLMVFMGCLPLYYIYCSEAYPFNYLDIIGFLVSFTGILFELISDEQLIAFKKKNKDNSSAFIDEGLWYYSRHPNYFGEILFWMGLFLMGLSADSNAVWTACGWLAVLLMFQLASIPMMEKRMREKRPYYKEYRKKVSRLMPWFRKD